jgi:virginiamycin B lyase
MREYPLPESNSSIMRPAIDAKGRVWFGEMGHNSLTVFDPQTETFQQSTPPQGKNGIMGIVIAPDDTVWFAEQYANYIGHYTPSTKQYQLHKLPTLSVPDPENKKRMRSLPSAPNDVTLDTQGNVWFTQVNSDMIGMLNPKTGQIKHYPLSPKKTIQTLNPYGITIDAQGIVWFTETHNSSLGRLDPQSGAVLRYPIPDASTVLMEITSDEEGNLWSTAFNNGLVFKFNPVQRSFTTYRVPSGGGIYDIIVAPGEAWVTVPSTNAIARLDTTRGTFTSYPIPTPNSTPLGIAMGANRTLWVTEASTDKLLQYVANSS